MRHEGGGVTPAGEKLAGLPSPGSEGVLSPGWDDERKISRGSSQPYISSVRGKTLHMHVCLFVYVCVCACAWQDSIHAYVSVCVCCVCVSGKSLYMHILTCSMYFFPLYKRTRFFQTRALLTSSKSMLCVAIKQLPRRPGRVMTKSN